MGETPYPQSGDAKLEPSFRVWFGGRGEGLLETGGESGRCKNWGLLLRRVPNVQPDRTQPRRNTLTERRRNDFKVGVTAPRETIQKTLQRTFVFWRFVFMLAGSVN